MTVFRALQQRLPQESLIYLGDTARVPYGTKSPETVQKYSQENVHFLLQKKIKLVVIACNTASAFALDRLQAECPVPVIGVVTPGVKAALEKSRSFRIGVIGTEGTIRSGAYEKEIRRAKPQADVTSIACPLFVPLVEEGWLQEEPTRLTAVRYLSPLQDRGMDTLILGCTHYPLLKPLLREVLPGMALVDSAEATAVEVQKILQEKKWLQAGRSSPSHQFFVTDSPERFRRVGEIFMGRAFDHVQKIQL